MRKILIVALAVLLSGPALAQKPKDALGVPGGIIKPPATTSVLTGNAGADLKALWQKIVTASAADLTYASALAGAAGTAPSKVRKQCWDAISAANAQANGDGLKNPDGTPMVKPDPALFSDIEIFAETIDNLSPQGALFTSCAGAAEMAKMSVIQFIAAAVGGITTFGAVGLP